MKQYLTLIKKALIWVILPALLLPPITILFVIYLYKCLEVILNLTGLS